VPPGVVTVTSTRAGLSAGETAVIEVAELTVNEAAPLLPKLTAVAPVRLAPLILTLVPPVEDPRGGETLRTLGGGPLVAPKPISAPSRLPT
jgi:hypothetical protein